ncbi:MAG: glycosyltransferase family 2 protein [Prochloron sp. SP5CPC1]|nr:glycosyltransferase family 2 protein [Candidatus Paraprochloron terpiosi SP5CPC1]
MSKLLPISAIIPTRDRPLPLKRMLSSLGKQSVQPVEAIIIDGSSNEETTKLCQTSIPNLDTKLIYHKATEIGAAIQRNQAMAYANEEAILFLDDDIIFEPDCLKRLWTALQNNPHLGGVNAMITNQKYSPPGPISRFLFPFLHGKLETSYAGKCIGPAFNLLPEDRPDLPAVVEVEWLNTTCTLYRREALPEHLFDPLLTRYRLMEDLTLSLKVGKNWQLANARTARIFHDSQPGDHKNNPTILGKMELINRHYIMTQILERNTWWDYVKLTVFQLWQIAAVCWHNFSAVGPTLMGKLAAIKEIIFPL